MKRIVGLFLVLLVIVLGTITVFANVTRDKKGDVVSRSSNAGSATAQANRSETGTDMKTTHDGLSFPKVR